MFLISAKKRFHSFIQSCLDLLSNFVYCSEPGTQKENALCWSAVKRPVNNFIIVCFTINVDNILSANVLLHWWCFCADVPLIDYEVNQSKFTLGCVTTKDDHPRLCINYDVDLMARDMCNYHIISYPTYCIPTLVRSFFGAYSICRMQWYATTLYRKRII